MNRRVTDRNGEEHFIHTTLEGHGLDEVMTPACGWQGRGYAAYNSWQYTNVREQIDEHAESLK